MAHASENSKRLSLEKHVVFRLTGLGRTVSKASDVYLFHFPEGRTDRDAMNSDGAFEKLGRFIEGLDSNSTVCFFTSPPDAARLQMYLDEQLKFQLWVTVKTPLQVANHGAHPQQHAALLVFTRYRTSLQHTKTRIAYTYCPACGKTTKDYGGKKHVYHEYGTLMSDVWRDIEVDPSSDIMDVVDRVRDLFGIEGYNSLSVVDLKKCSDLLPKEEKLVKQQVPLFESKPPKLKSGQLLINGDSLKELKKIPSNSVDFCFTDPPYNLEKKYDNYHDALELREYFAWCDKWLSQLARVIKPGRTVAILIIPLRAIRHYQHLCKELDFQSWIVSEAMGLPVRMIMPSHYSIVCFSKGQPRNLPYLMNDHFSEIEKESLLPLGESYCLRASCINNRMKRRIDDRGKLSDLWYDIHRLKHNTRRVEHPTQLPPMLMRRLYSIFTKQGETILDCFNGSGTSTLVAQQMNRQFVGIELSERYHKLAEKRHHELSMGHDPFGKKEVIPKAKNSRVPRMVKQQYKVSKKVLQLEVRRIAQRLNRLPTREEVRVMSKFPIKYYDDYFISWGEVCAAARTTGMSEYPADKTSIGEQTRLFTD